MAAWLQNILAILTGAAAWEGFKFIYPEVQRWLTNKRNAANELQTHLSPLLKAADELFGKMVSLAKEDFSIFTRPELVQDKTASLNRKYVYFLFAQFWANIEFIRMNHQFSSIGKTTKGEHLIKFIETLESRDFRIFERSLQRMIGEAMIEEATGKTKIMSLNQFYVSSDRTGTHFAHLIKQLEERFLKSADKKERQRILVFGAVVSMLINHFDSKHKIVRNRKLYTSKLSERSKKLISGGLFQHYIPFLAKKEKRQVRHLANGLPPALHDT